LQKKQKASVFYFVPHPPHKSFYTTHFLPHPINSTLAEKAKELFFPHTKISCKKAAKAK
jgi:hypothetical protein